MTVVGWTVAPKDVHILIPRTRERYKRQKNFAAVIQLRIWRWGSFPGLSRCAWCNHNGPHKRDAGGSTSYRRWCDGGERGTGRKIFEDVKPLALKVEEGAVNQGKQVTSVRWKKYRNRVFPRGIRRSQPCLHLDFSPEKLVLDFWAPEL